MPAGGERGEKMMQKVHSSSPVQPLCAPSSFFSFPSSLLPPLHPSLLALLGEKLTPFEVKRWVRSLKKEIRKFVFF